MSINSSFYKDLHDMEDQLNEGEESQREEVWIPVHFFIWNHRQYASTNVGTLALFARDILGLESVVVSKLRDSQIEINLQYAS